MRERPDVVPVICPGPRADRRAAPTIAKPAGVFHVRRFLEGARLEELGVERLTMPELVVGQRPRREGACREDVFMPAMASRPHTMGASPAEEADNRRSTERCLRDDEVQPRGSCPPRLRTFPLPRSRTRP